MHNKINTTVSTKKMTMANKTIYITFFYMHQ